MSSQPASQGTSDVRSVMQPRRPAHAGKIEKARDPRHALIRLIPYLKPFRLALAMVVSFVLIYTILGLIGPYLMGVSIDRFIATQQAAGLAPLQS